MKPILFAETQTDFTTNGIGRLSDAISCTVTEERNGQYELHMEYPIDGHLIEEVKHSRIIVATPADDKAPQPFCIYQITKPLSGVIEIDAEHISYRLSHIPLMPFTAVGIDQTFSCFKSCSAESNPFTFTKEGTFGTVVGNTFKVTEPENLRAAGQRYIENNDVGSPTVSIDVSFVALHQTQEYADLTHIEHINLCDTVKVIFPALDVSTKARVVKTVWNVLLERYDSITIGAVSSRLSATLQASQEAAGKNTWNLTNGALSLSSDATFGGRTMAAIISGILKTASDDISNAISAYDESLDKEAVVSKMDDEGFYIGQDGHLHIIPDRVITDGANIEQRVEQILDYEDWVRENEGARW